MNRLRVRSQSNYLLILAPPRAPTCQCSLGACKLVISGLSGSSEGGARLPPLGIPFTLSGRSGVS
ncbi:MAG: hypothetical protein ACI835_003602 [Planctomycetota bacterium]|jgi:hypothetical protein